MDLESMKAALATVTQSLTKIGEDVRGYAAKASDEIKALGAMHGETAGKLNEVFTQGKKLGEEFGEIKQRLTVVEQKNVAALGGEAIPASPGAALIESKEYKALIASGGSNMGHVPVGSFRKTAVVNATGVSQPLVAPDRYGTIIPPGLERLSIRNLIPSVRTGSNLIQFVRESSADMVAEPQYSSPKFENVLKKEAAVAFELVSIPVQTLAHWLPVSRQVLADAAALAGYIDTRLTYGVKDEEEKQLLNGDGLHANLTGLLAAASAFSHTGSGATDTIIDQLLRAITQVTLSNFTATGIVLHPTDWMRIQLAKDTQGRYLFGNPSSTGPGNIWGLPVVPTQRITSGHFLTGAFAAAATIFDREDASVRIAEQHADFSVRNMVAVIAEERVALAVYRGSAFVTGTFEA